MKFRKDRRQVNLAAGRRTCKSGRTAAGERVKIAGQQPGLFTGYIGMKRRREIIDAYSSILGSNPRSTLMNESHLPFPRELIQQSIFEELSENPDSMLRDHLEIAYAQLECFLPSEQYELVNGFTLAGRLAEEVAVSGRPEDILKSAEILKCARGDQAVEIQESVSARIHKRLLQIRSMSAFSLPGSQDLARPSPPSRTRRSPGEPAPLLP